MLSRFAKTLLVCTAFAPILLTLGFVKWRAGHAPSALGCIAAAVALAWICRLVLEASITQLEVLPLKLQSIKTADTEIVGYVLSYLLPLASVPGESFDPVVAVFVAMFFLVIVATTHSYHFNPLMSLLGYHFYEVTDATGVSYVLVTKRSLRSARGTARVVQISEYILLDVEGRSG